MILLNGSFKDIAFHNENVRTIFVVIKNITIKSEEDLTQLGVMTFNLDGHTNYGGFSDLYGTNKVGKGTGTIVFGKVSKINNVIYGDGRPNNPVRHPYIVAGKLEMNLLTTLNYSLTAGRFDVTILSNTSRFIIY